MDRADAALLICDESQAMLTISANEELFFTRRLDLPQGFLAMPWGSGTDAVADAAPDAFTPVSEYVPDYAGGSASAGAASADQGDADRVQRFVVEVQRSLDLWDRTWSSMPLSGLRVYAGDRSTELADWWSREMGQTVSAIDVAAQFPGFDSMAIADQMYCLPLLGVLLRTETRKL
jgi:MSHA biogenesis protein MshI